jgi:hypothetical protein
MVLDQTKPTLRPDGQKKTLTLCLLLIAVHLSSLLSSLSLTLWWYLVTLTIAQTMTLADQVGREAAKGEKFALMMVEG